MYVFMKKTFSLSSILIAFFVGVLLVGAVFLARPPEVVSVSDSDSDINGLAITTQDLTVSESAFDFGEISMAAGKVSKVFTVRNTSDAVKTITKMYTSCMCTDALLSIDQVESGPYGMPGHGATVPRVDRQLNVGQEATITVTFDPAAHGPSGVGAIKRTVSVETGDSATPLQFSISAVVTP